MMVRNVLLGLVSFFICFQSAQVIGADRKLEFKSKEFQLLAETGKPYRLALRDLLKDQGSGDLIWSVINSTPPAWLTVDVEKEEMHGNPVSSNAGTSLFYLSVMDNGTGESGGIAKITMNVVIAPQWTENPVQLGQHPENVPYQFDLKTKITFAGTGPLSFTSTDPDGDAPWLSLSPAGILSGTPKRQHIGPYEVTVTATTSQGASATVEAVGTVLKVISPPKWVANPLVIQDAKEDFDYSFSVAGSVNNPEGQPLKFELVQGAPTGWIKMAEDGTLSGKPIKADLGALNLTAKVSSIIDGQTYSDQTVLKLTVLHTNHAPTWKANPVVLPGALTWKPYSQDLKPFTEDYDGDKLTFSLINGPIWATISEEGILSGTADKPHIGLNSWTMEISDGELKAQAVVQITVVKANEPPRWLAKPTLLPNAKEDFEYSQNLLPLVVDPDGDAVIFTVVSGPNWVSLTPEGGLSGTPGALHVGLNTFKIKVSDGIAGEDIADVQVTVEHTNHPPTWAESPIRITVSEKQPMSENIAQYAEDKDSSDKLAFLKVSGPPWGTLSEAGVLAGTPQKEQIGEHKFVVRVDDQMGGTADVDVFVTVKNVNDPPFWTNDPVVLPATPEKVAYTQSVASFAGDEDTGDTLTFNKISGPAWASFSAKGDVTGTPNRPDVGLNVFKVRVTDAAGAFKEADVHIQVNKVNIPPRWLQDPITLTNALEDAAYSYNVSGFAVDDDGDALTFSKIAGPDWLIVGKNGALSGTPHLSDVGNFTARFEVEDAVASAQVTANGKVVMKNYPPTIDQNNLQFTVKERENFKVSLNDPKYVEDKNGDTLAFSLKDTVNWITLSSNGELFINPLHSHLGDHSINFRVSDGTLYADAVLNIKVVRDPRPPQWLENPITFTTPARVPFSGSIAAKAKDLDGVPLTFSKKSGPDWLTVGTNGSLSGTPGDEHVGENAFVVTATNDVLSTDADLNITVTVNNHPPTVNQDSLHFTVKERETLDVDLKDPKYISDLDGDALKCTLLATSDWVKLSPDCKLNISPLFKHIGDHTISFRVEDAKDEVQANLYIKVERNPRPPEWLENPIHFTATTRKIFRGSVTGKAEDSDGLPITFLIKSGPDWLKAEPSGNIQGTPQDEDVGKNTFVITVKNDVLGADASMIINVLPGNKDPYWTQNPIVLQSATVGKPYNKSIAEFAKDPDSDPLTFSKVSGPDWLNVSTSGQVIGTPKLANLGLNEFKVQVDDPDHAHAETVVQITVEKPNTPPRWLEEPVLMADAFTDTNYHFSLRPLATDPDGDVLIFKKVNGPAWLNIAGDGLASGKPAASNLGDYTGVLEVCDPKECVQAGAIGRVLRKNDPPVINQANLSFTVKERQVYNFQLNDPKYVSDPDGDALTFKLTDTSEWVSLAGSGELALKPLFPHIGDHSLKFTVSDGKLIAEGLLNIKVERDPRPPQWLEDPVRFEAVVRKMFNATLADKVKDLDGIALTFTKKSGPTWLSVDSKGNLTGTPQESDMGENTFTVVVKNDLLEALGTVIVTVVTDNKPPFWTQDPVRLPDGKAAATYAESVASFAKDPEGERLTFEKMAGPEWAFITTSGLIIGTPTESNQGMNSLTVRAMDPQKAYADATVQIVIGDGVNNPPQWTQNPIPLGSIPIDLAYSFSLSKLAMDPDGDKLLFKKAAGPTWMYVSSDGIISGVPRQKDLGQFTAQFEVSDGKASALADAFGTVVDGSSNKPPQIKPEAWSFILKENQTMEVNLNQAQYVVDPDGDPLTFEILNGAEWITLSSAGNLSLQPLHKHIGDHEFQVKVSDDKGASDQGRLFVRVLEDSEAPYWLEDPIYYTTFVNKPLNEDISSKAKDPKGKTLTFSKKSGPLWLTVAADGKLSGTPLNADLGQNVFTVSASNGTLSADVAVIITVKEGGDTEDNFIVDEPVSGAPSENVWVVDNSWPWVGKNLLIEQLAKHIDVYFSKLEYAGLHHKGIYLSSDYTKWQNPIKDADNKYFMEWQDNGVSNKFRYRLDKTKTSSCYNSPIWAMFCFYCKVEEKLTEIYNNFFTENVPMDVLILTSHKDYYRKYSFGSAQAGWNANDYADNFMAFHAKEKQPYRISAVAPECPELKNPYPLEKEIQPLEKDESSYRILVRKTKGELYPYDCNVDMEKILRDYAEDVIFRSYVVAHNRLTLSKEPLNPKEIELSIGGNIIAGNTGSNTDKWYYEGNRIVVIRWYLFDLSQVKPGDKIRIKYRG